MSNLVTLRDIVLEDNPNFKVIDGYVHLCEVLNKEKDKSKVDKEFVLIRKNKQYSMSLNASELEKNGFKVSHINNYNGKDEVHVRHQSYYDNEILQEHLQTDSPDKLIEQKIKDVLLNHVSLETRTTGGSYGMKESTEINLKYKNEIIDTIDLD